MSLRRNHPVEWSTQAEYYAATAPSGPELIRKRLESINHQVEIVFSDERLKKLKLLRKYMKGDPENWLKFEDIAAIHRVRVTCDDVWEMVEAVKNCSQILQVDESRASIRRVSPYRYVKVADKKAKVKAIKKLLSSQSAFSMVGIRPQSGGVIIQFETSMIAKKAVNFFKANGDWRGSTTYFVCDRFGKKPSDDESQPNNSLAQDEGQEEDGAKQKQSQQEEAPPKKKRTRKKNKGPESLIETETVPATTGNLKDDEEAKANVENETKDEPSITKETGTNNKSNKIVGIVTSLIRENTVASGEVMVGFLRLESSTGIKGVRRRGRRTQTYEFQIPVLQGLRVGDRVQFQQVETSTTIRSLEKLAKAASPEEEASTPSTPSGTRPAHLRLSKALNSNTPSKSGGSPSENSQTELSDQTSSSLANLSRRLVSYVQARGPDRSGDIGFTGAHWRGLRAGRSLNIA